MFWSPSQHYLPIDDGRRDDLLDGNLLKLALTMMSQSVIKHFLTEGDKMVLSWYSPLRDQGGYAIAVNYGQQ
jgi:oligosaccharide translocation protein RFT1